MDDAILTISISLRHVKLNLIHSLAFRLVFQAKNNTA